MQTDKTEKNNLIVPSLIFAAAFLIFGFMVSLSLGKFSNKGNSITVTGSAERLVESDMAKWTVTINSRSVDGLTSKFASQEVNKNSGLIRDHLVKQGIQSEKISLAPVSISQICELTSQGYENCALGIRGYNVSQNIIVESEDVNKITDLSKNISSVFENMTINFNNVEYYYNKLKDIRVEMLSEATKNAKERAESVALAGGAKVNTITSLSSGVFQVTPKNSVDISDYGTYDTTTIEKKITATVKVDFSLK